MGVSLLYVNQRRIYDMDKMHVIPPFSDAMKAVQSACRLFPDKFRYQDKEEMANELLLRYWKAQEAGRPYTDSRPLKQMALNLATDLARIKSIPQFSIGDMSLPWTPEEEAQELVGFLRSKWSRPEQKIIDALTDGVPPTPKHLSEATGLPLEKAKTTLRQIRITLRSNAIAELDRSIVNAVDTENVDEAPSILSVPINIHHRVQLHLLFHRRCIAYLSFITPDLHMNRLGAVSYSTKHIASLTTLNKCDNLSVCHVIMCNLTATLFLRPCFPQLQEIGREATEQLSQLAQTAFRRASASGDPSCISQASSIIRLFDNAPLENSQSSPDQFVTEFAQLIECWANPPGLS